MKVLVVIPARLASTRFPNKPLAKIFNREMILWVLDALHDYEKIVATPDEVIAEVVRAEGYEAYITKREAKTGTDRLVEVAENIDADIYVNVQGDEPLINPLDVDRIIEAKIDYPDYVIGGMCELDNNQNSVKLIIDERQLAISRKVYKQVGIYAFNKTDLLRFGKGEEWESIEITRFIDSGYPVRFVQVTETQAVDMPEDIKRVEAILWQKK